MIRPAIAYTRRPYGVAAVCVIGLGAVWTLACGPSQAAVRDDVPSATTQKARLDATGCAANCLYVACRLNDRPATYEECFEILPRRDSGNTMLELKGALEERGLRVVAERLSPEELAQASVLQIPLLLKQNTANKVGHYVVVRPIDGRTVQVLDFPAEKARLIDRGALAAHLRRTGQNKIPTLQIVAADPSGPPDEVGSAAALDNLRDVARPPPRSDSVARRHSPLVTLRDAEKPATASFVFPDAAENEVVTCVFDVTNGTSRPVTLKEVKGECECASITADFTSLIPGQVGRLRLTSRWRSGRVTLTHPQLRFSHQPTASRPCGCASAAVSGRVGILGPRLFTLGRSPLAVRRSIDSHQAHAGPR